ncbi:DUF167 domain-containing protein [bacterium]|nr:DUF167 domain-containing protein [bacterium]
MTDKIDIAVRVIPNAPATRCESRDDDGVYKIRVQAVPEKGKANKALVRFLAKQLGLGRSCVELLAGETGRHKRLGIHGLTDEEVQVRLLG